MINTTLAEKLNFQREDVFLDGSKIFTVPLKGTKGKINFLGVPQHGRVIYVGSGGCCYGPISILEDLDQLREMPTDKPDFQLDAIRIPPFNVYDLIPAIVDYKKTGFGNDGAISATGFGCTGSGVKLIGTLYPDTLEVVPYKEFKELERGVTDYQSVAGSMPMPRQSVDLQGNKITLDFLKAGYRLKPGCPRKPKLPAVLIDDNYEPYISQEVLTSKDLTPILKEIGVEVEKTIEANRGYVRIRR